MINGVILAQGGKNLWGLDQGSSLAPQIDALFNFILIVSCFFFVLIVGVGLWFIVRYRSRDPSQKATGTVTHNTPLEITWSIIPLILVCIMFWWGFKVYVDLRTPPQNAYEIQVRAQQWEWEFTYPNGETDNNLHVPVDTPVRLVMRSDDVLHSMFIPVFRVKMDVVPGRYTDLWFEAKHVGTFKLLCAEFCGKGHSDMVRNVYVYAKEEFTGKLEKLNPLKGLSDEQYAEYKADPQKFIEGHPEVMNLLSPAEMGAQVYEKKGCRACHSVDGEPGTGPTFFDLWGREERITDGPSVVVDENYVRESIVDPNAKIVQGFRAQMSSYQGKITDRQIDALIAYFKTLKKRP